MFAEEPSSSRSNSVLHLVEKRSNCVGEGIACDVTFEGTQGGTDENSILRGESLGATPCRV